jgi:hypothetical protein
MAVDRTELEWIYEPSAFFEAPLEHATADFCLSIDKGKAVASLTRAADPIPTNLEMQIKRSLESILRLRQLQSRKTFKLEGPRIYQYSDGRKHVSIRLEGGSLVLTGGEVDFTIHDSKGNIVRDSRAERIARDHSILAQLGPKIPNSITLQSLLDSFSRSIADPDDELVHLYEVRDALAGHFGGGQAARNALGIDKRDWQRLGLLANVEPLKQGRHRGRNPQGRRPATNVELEEARRLVRNWIIAFGRTL